MSSLAKALSVAIIFGAAGQAAAADNATIATRALGVIRNNPVPTRLSANDAFVTRDVIVGRDGTEHVRFDRTYKGLPVIGGDLVVHSKAGVLKRTSLTQASAINVSTTPTITSAAAIATAGRAWAMAYDVSPTSRLVVFAPAAKTPKLAHDVVYVGRAKDGTPIRMHYYVDAVTGAILDKTNAIKTGTLPGTGYPTGNTPPPPNVIPSIGPGFSLFAGNVTLNTQFNNTRRIYELIDPTRGNTSITDMGNGYRTGGTLMVDADNRWGNNALSDRVSAGVDAMYGFQKTWDFYKNKFNRNGIRNNGQGANGAVHYFLNYTNAFWNDDCFCMSFGDGNGTTVRPLVSIDIVGHEVSHGVTAATANLTYASESGGLNEATSDIFGAMIEYYANNAKQPPNYVIGEQIFTTPAWNKFIRTMFKPNLDGLSPDCYPSATTPSNGISLGNFKAMDVHYSSGVANHFFYLLAEGVVVPADYAAGTPANLGPSNLVCNGNTGLTGIGRDAAMQIWYHALTVYMTSNSDYAAARAATAQAAIDLYGAGSTQHNAVIDTWAAVSMP
ncbi:M4 family metallopeptidase [Lysobacter sp. A6]|uniref:Neutral metalloproteinase n=1 Tax=Noviluteimonas lactosilytica TaxID=2888523 RepID=A0ABS8JIA0_9GAMM|nr:M4 family metallopeptidase [Lysobacter lactosilyticus]MCC8363338.1 M4 family metallopeptidase [Lysobacter lactosilyticus]